MRRGVGPAVCHGTVVPVAYCGGGICYPSLANGPLSKRWAKPLFQPFVKCSVVLCLGECSPAGAGGPGQRLVDSGILLGLDHGEYVLSGLALNKYLLYDRALCYYLHIKYYIIV